MSQVNNNTPAVNSAATNTNSKTVNPEALLLNMFKDSDNVSSTSEGQEVDTYPTIASSSNVHEIKDENSNSQEQQIELFTDARASRQLKLNMLRGERQLTREEQKELRELNKIEADTKKLALENPEKFLDLVANAVASSASSLQLIRMDSVLMSCITQAMKKLEGENPRDEHYNQSAFYNFEIGATAGAANMDVNHDGKVDHTDIMMHV